MLEPDQSAWSFCCSSDQCWSCPPALPVSKTLLNYCCWGAEAAHCFRSQWGKALHTREKTDFFMKTAWEETSNLYAGCNFIGHRKVWTQGFQLEKAHSPSGNINRPFCPALMVPRRGFPSVLPSARYLLRIPEVYAGQRRWFTGKHGNQ